MPNIVFLLLKESGICCLPAVGDVLLGKHKHTREQKTFHRFERCVVEDVNEEKSKIRVFYFDIGEVQVVDLSDLKVPNKHIMKVMHEFDI